MIPEKTVLTVNNVDKFYSIYQHPVDRLKETFSIRRKEYHEKFYALKNISFDLKKGETFGIIGKNGAGKSTLLKIISGVLSPSSGDVKIDGTIASLLELGAGFDPELSGYENIFFYGSLMGINRAEMSKVIDQIKAFADIGAFIDRPVKTYSSGMYARLAFSVAINVKPSILIVDEVLSVGDKAFQKKCLVKVNQLREQGVSIIFVSHDDYMLRTLCKRAMYIDSGEVVYLGDVDECLNRYNDISKDTAIDTEDLSITNDFVFSIKNVRLFNSKGIESQQFNSGESVTIKFVYDLKGTYDDEISFVVNLYRNDQTYIFGTTSIMDGMATIKPNNKMNDIEIVFPNMPVLAGKYIIRLAINDSSGLGIICEANPAITFKVTDELEAVGVINLEREWGGLWNE